MSDSSGSNGGSLVDEELCGDLEQTVDGDTQIILEEACTLPCPGNTISFSVASVCMSSHIQSDYTMNTLY